MTAPTPNAELAYKVLDHIDAHPQQWRQGWWFTELDCGTAACFAGWACVLSGYKPHVADADAERIAGETDMLGDLDLLPIALALLIVLDDAPAVVLHRRPDRQAAFKSATGPANQLQTCTGRSTKPYDVGTRCLTT
jgi:hypothetical protein